ncbi:MAG: helix-turn-helix domain-containing protein [Treponema sp.]|jgi:transcriptional regulator with XRE-family HTH domain|nr:helix-turn-helix domain-containing protein [Treponema sp.]
MTFQTVFITNVQLYRKERGLSQLKLAELCNSSQTYIAEIEAGKKFPSPGMIEKMAAALELESYILFQNTPPAGVSERVLSPIQKKEITGKISVLVEKIINQY